MESRNRQETSAETVLDMSDALDDGMCRNCGRARAIKTDGTGTPVCGFCANRTPRPVRNPKIRVGRNMTCPCGSGKKLKRCCRDAVAAFRIALQTGRVHPSAVPEGVIVATKKPASKPTKGNMKTYPCRCGLLVVRRPGDRVVFCRCGLRLVFPDDAPRAYWIGL